MADTDCIMEIKRRLAKCYGSLNNFSDMMSIHFRSGMNVLPMLRKWDDRVEWRFGQGEPRGYSPGTVWLCHNEETDRLFLRFHGGEPVKEHDGSRTIKISDIKVTSRVINDIGSKEARLKSLFERANK